MQNRVANLVFFILVGCITVAFFGLIKDFALGAFWAVVLGIIFYGTYEKVLSFCNGHTVLASGLTLLLVILIVIIPVGLVGLAVANQAIEIAGYVEDGTYKPSDILDKIQDSIPNFLQQWGLDTENLRERISTWAGESSEQIATKALGITQNIFSALVQMAITLYVLFFVFRDGKFLVEKLIYVLPIGDEKEMQLMERFQSVSRATVKGNILISVIQGGLGAALFVILGIPGAMLLGVLMVIAALLPVGAVMIWGPVAVILFINGEVTDAIIVLVAGALFIGLIDNLLRPRLVGNDTKMPDYLVLISTLGGLAWFGLSGFVIGPVIAAMFVTCWEMVGDEYGEKRVEKVNLKEDLNTDSNATHRKTE